LDSTPSSQAKGMPPLPHENAQTGPFSPPALSLPKGGGAIQGIGEKFAANPVTGTGSMTVPLAVSPGRAGFGPQLALSYDSGNGNGPFGFGWSLGLPSISRKMDKGLPQYRDFEESDTFVLSGAEDLVPLLTFSNEKWQRTSSQRTVAGTDYSVHSYRPRIEGLFARIERWVDRSTGQSHWRSISRDNVTALYGRTAESRIADPADPSRIFRWLICESYDDKGNAIVYGYKAENSENVYTSLAHERNRNEALRSCNRLLKRIRYGNLVSRLVQSDLSATGWMFEVVFDYGDHDPENPVPLEVNPWLCRHDPFSSYRAGFEVRTYRLCQRVLMFHHFPDEPDVGQDCLVRSTDFAYRSSRNIAEDVTKGNPLASFVASVTQSGYKRKPAGGYLKKSMPPLEFGYSDAVIDETIHEIAAESLKNLPVGLDSSTYRWADLDGEGVSGILTEQANQWFFKPNLGQGRFGPAGIVSEKPSSAALRSGQQQLLDVAGDSQLDLVALSGPTPGFFERTQDKSWDQFTPFSSLPNIQFDDPNLRFIDLDGDGHADVLITGTDVFIWHHSLAREGFGPAQRVAKAFDEEKGPKLIFADGTQSVYLADMSGDGLTDLVRIRNGEVCYWPNLGYGNFGAKVLMDNPPWLDFTDLFDQRRVRLADIDGSGTTDLIYLAKDGAHLYFNLSGNQWGEMQLVGQFPSVENFSNVTTVDLLGNGTACLVWSSPLPGDARAPMRYIDLMGGQKPHLLISLKNNLGAETVVQYRASTKFYLADKAAGQPWITRLPFPVHAVERVETYDRISRNRFVTRYAYHHGFYDGIEREFRGFGRVDQWDTEEFATLSVSGDFPIGDNVDASSHVPPVLTKTWFHTGAYFQEGRISKQFEHEYYREGDKVQGVQGLTDRQLEAMLIPDTVFPSTVNLQDGKVLVWQLSADELRESCRALKGSILRQEIYGLDGTEAQDRPYSVSERNYTIECLQPQSQNKHAVFFTHSRETIDFHYERMLYKVAGGTIVDTNSPASPNAILAADPRVSHAVTLEVDSYGNVLESVAIGYGRRFDEIDPILTVEDKRKQKQILVTFLKNAYTNPVLSDDVHRTPLPSETRTYELVHATPEANQTLITNLFRFSELQAKTAIASDGTHDIPYEDTFASGTKTAEPYRRLLERSRTLYRKDDLAGPLPQGGLESLALPHETYKLAFTPALLSSVYQRPRTNQLPETLLTDQMSILGKEGGYVELDADGHWWAPSGQVRYSPGTNNVPAQELAYAQQHFFIPCLFQDPFQQVTTITYDLYDLLILDTQDTAGNHVTAGERDGAGNVTLRSNDYRILKPAAVMDPNRNRSAVAFDALGMVVGTAVMGKPEENLGDSLAGFTADLDDSLIAKHLQDPLARPQDILQNATTRLVYDLFAYFRTKNDPQAQPSAVYALAREMHISNLAPGQFTRIQHAFSYSDGFGREIQKKAQAEPGPLTDMGPVASPRWAGSGWTIYNNKGKPVRQHEPFFTATHNYEFAVKVGISPILCYDPAERAIATIHPNHTYEKVVFDAWHQDSWDVNDTVLQTDPTADPDVGGFFRLLPASDYFPTWYSRRISGDLGFQEKDAATKAKAHANTPTTAHFDSLGRTFLTVLDNAGGTKFPSRIELDIEGSQRSVRDAIVQAGDQQGRIVMRYDYDMLRNRIHQASMEAGRRWMLNDVAGKAIRSWDSRGHTFRKEYDAIRRPTNSFVLGTDPDNSDPRTLAGEILHEKIVYGEGQPNDQALNLRTRVVQHYDMAGVVTNIGRNPATNQDEGFDFKGNLLSSSRALVADYKSLANWATPPPLVETFGSNTQYDALNRPIALTTPDSSVIRPTYNEANLLKIVNVNLRGAATPTPFVANIDYNAKGQRALIEYGNNTRTNYTYDPFTFRLLRLTTTRAAVSADQQIIQDLFYTYDPTGNVTRIQDNSDIQNVVFFRNRRVEPSSDYTYDAIYRLIQATGREQLGLSGGSLLSPWATSYSDVPRVNLPHPGDGNAMGTYIEKYEYDAVGNFQKMIHRGANPSNPGWTRSYTYAETSVLESSKVSNRLTSTTISGRQPLTELYSYDLHGSINTMPHLQIMLWNFKDELLMTQRQAVNADDQDGAQQQGERTYYVYDASGQRIRKTTESSASVKIKERLYLGTFELYREYHAHNAPTLARETLHVMDDKSRIALFEINTTGSSTEAITRFQFDNHLQTTCLELDDEGEVISFEEYYPYGSTSYQAGRSVAEVSQKRYRHTGKERDDETALYYHGARYYIPWVGRWISCDPEGPSESANSYIYVGNNPSRYRDPNGRWGEDMHFAAVYVAGRLQGASPAEAMHAAIASQAMDDYRNLAAPSLKLRASGILSDEPGTTNDPITEGILDKFQPKPELNSPVTLPRKRDFFGSVLEDPGLENRLANNAHALGVTYAQSQEVARTGIIANNLTMFGLGLHTVGDFLAHANTTGFPTFGHQMGKNEDYTDVYTLTSADETPRNPRKALATFMNFMELWSEMKHTPGGPVKLSQEQLLRLDDFLRRPALKDWALESLLRGVGADDAEIKSFRAASDPNVRRSMFEADVKTMDGRFGLQAAMGGWLSRPNDSTLVTLKTDVKVYTEDPSLPDIAHYQFGKIHHYAPHPHFQPY
jgi:RHS repeat-associated protein